MFKISAWNKHHLLAFLKSFPLIPNTPIPPPPSCMGKKFLNRFTWITRVMFFSPKKRKCRGSAIKSHACKCSLGHYQTDINVFHSEMISWWAGSDQRWFGAMFSISEMRTVIIKCPLLLFCEVFGVNESRQVGLCKCLCCSSMMFRICPSRICLLPIFFPTISCISFICAYRSIWNITISFYILLCRLLPSTMKAQALNIREIIVEWVKSPRGGIV